MDENVTFEEVQAADGYNVAFAMLNAEKSLNALSQGMIDALVERLAVWRERPDIACVVMHSAGDRAFCAGGDVIGLYDAMTATLTEGGSDRPAERFFESEYRLDYTIHTYPKPILCWGNGTVMGGGLGVMAGASHRVVTEGSLIAMPEVTIGLFPDVGATWFLNRMPGRTGLYLALTGMPLNAGDALLSSLADFFIRSDSRDQVFSALTSLEWSADARTNRGVLSHCLREFADQSRAALPASEVLAHQETIARLTDACTVEEIQAAVERHQHSSAWIQRGAQTMARAAPVSLRVTFEQLTGGRHLSLKEAFMREFCMAAQFTRHPDFAEGIRALLVDKDHEPRWTPARLEEVSDAYVASHFVLPDDYREHPLNNL